MLLETKISRRAFLQTTGALTFAFTFAGKAPGKPGRYFVEITGLALEPDIVAGLVLYRVVTLAVPMLFGLVSIALWRRTNEREEPTHATP